MQLSGFFFCTTKKISDNDKFYKFQLLGTGIQSTKIDQAALLHKCSNDFLNQKEINQK
jgi:hypothetical protein